MAAVGGRHPSVKRSMISFLSFVLFSLSNLDIKESKGKCPDDGGLFKSKSLHVSPKLGSTPPRDQNKSG